MPPIEVRELPLDQLTPAPYNPRRALKPDGPAYRKLQRSLEEFGLVEPLVWNELTGRVVGGHARLAIWRALGHATAPVSVVRLTEARERALNVVLNNLEAQGRYDPAKLAAVLEDLDGLPEATLTGFDPGMLRSLKLAPLADLPAEDSPARVEVTLVVPADRFVEVEPAIDILVRDHRLESHVRQV
jgi:ParB-like chromosome segregation protein Spo0J